MFETDPRERRALYFALAAVSMWSTVAVAFKIALSYMPPALLLFWAALFSCLVLALVVSYTKQWQELRSWRRREWFYSLLLGLMNPCFYYLFLFGAYNRLPAQEAQAINYSWAILLALLSVPILKHRLSTKDILAGLLCYGGVVVIATRGDLLALEFTDLYGVALALVSTLIWALYWLFSTRDHRHPVVGLMVNFAFAIPLLAVINLSAGNVLLPNWPGVLAAAYVGVFEMGLAFVCWLQAMRLTRKTASISNLIFLSPFISLVLIYLLLGETIYPSTLVGLSTILAGVFLQRYRKSSVE